MSADRLRSGSVPGGRPVPGLPIPAGSGANLTCAESALKAKFRLPLIPLTMNGLEDRRVLITAGAGGIGRAIALEFAAAGSRVHVVDVDAEALRGLRASVSWAGRGAFSPGNVSDEPTVARMMRHQQERFGGIDVLINCAGIKGPTGPVETLELADWRECLAVNLDATFLCCKHSVPLLLEACDPSIINISSTAGWHGYPLRTSYASAKWAVIGLTKSLAMELGPRGVRVNAICPGSVTGERMDRVITEEAREKGVPEDRVRQNYTRGVSLRTFIDPEDIARTALFLASPAARRITGQAISVDGHLESPGGVHD